MKIVLSLIIVLLVNITSSNLYGETLIEKCSTSFETVVLPNEVTQEMYLSPDDEIISGKVWNRWTTDNFVVCSLSNNQGKYLFYHLEDIKTWLYSRWGLYDIDFQSPCKLICVEDKQLFSKLFRLENTVVEIRRNEDGSIKESIIFMLLDQSASKTVPMPLTEVCLAEFEQKYQVRFGWWLHRGTSILNGTIPNIRRIISNYKTDYSCDVIMSMPEEQYKTLSLEQRIQFDSAAMLLCLMIKKEFGTSKFQEIMKYTALGNSIEEAVVKVLGYKNMLQFNMSFDRYTNDLIMDVKTNKTPDTYLQIKAK